MSSLRYLLVGAFLLIASTALAFVPPAARILELWQGAYEKTPEVTLKGSWQQGAVSTPFRVSVQKSGITIVENGRPSTDATSRLVWDLLLRPTVATELLKTRGLSLNETGLARSESGITWVLGASGENRPGTQIWLNRDWLTPQRVILQRPSGSADTIEYLDYQVANRLFPQTIHSRLDGVERVYKIDDILPIK